MNTIGEDKKLNMSLDEIIASEPRRYTGSSSEKQLDSGRSSMKMYRPKQYGRAKHEPYRRARQNGERRRDNWSHYTPSPANVSANKDSEECPYVFKYNGVFVSENSPLLNRSLGEVEAIRKQAVLSRNGLEIVVDVGEDEDEDEDNEDCPKPTFINSRLNGRLMPQRKFHDMTYVRLPVHQRLGYRNANAKNQFLKSRVNNAARFLRSKKHQRLHQLAHFKAPSSSSQHGFFTKQLLCLNDQRLKSQNQKNLVDPGTQFTVSINNDLATNSLNQPVMQVSRLQSNNDGVFIAPLSRQNVEQLSGFFPRSGAGSQISSISKTNEDVLERLSKLENMLACSGTSMMNGYMPMSQQLVTSDAGSNISLVNGVPMAKVSSVPIHTSGLSLQKPVTLMVGNQVETFVPLVNSGASTSSQLLGQSVQGRVVQCQDNALVVQTSTIATSMVPVKPRMGRQLIIAANRQPLDVSIQNAISSAQASVSCTTNRVSRESLNYRPVPHITLSSINNRIAHFPPQNLNHR